MDYVLSKERPLVRMDSERSLGVGRNGGRRGVRPNGELGGIPPYEVVPEGRDEAVGVERPGLVGDCAVTN